MPINWRITCGRWGSDPRSWWPSAWSARWRRSSALLGILKAGGAYVPLDPAYPTGAPGLHAERCPGAGAVDPGAVGGAVGGTGCQSHLPGFRLGDHCPRKRREPRQLGPPRKPGLCHLHFGIDGAAQGRSDFAWRDCRSLPECAKATTNWTPAMSSSSSLR